MLITPDTDVTHLDLEKYFTSNDWQLFNNIRKKCSQQPWCHYWEWIPGISDDAHKDSIIERIMVSMFGRLRLLYLKEFAEGLNLCGVLASVRAHPEMEKRKNGKLWKGKRPVQWPQITCFTWCNHNTQVHVITKEACMLACMHVITKEPPGKVESWAHVVPT